MDSPSLSLVIPVFNSAGTLPRLVEEIGALAIPGGLELILVNDGSRDVSGDVCRHLAAGARIPVTVVDLSRNFGEHNAVMAGLQQARGAHVIIMDDDFQNPLAEVVRLLEHAQSSGADVVYTFYDDKKHAAWRNLLSRWTSRVADFVLDKPKGLYLCSFKCLSQFVVERIRLYQGPFPYIDGLIFQVSHRIETIQVAHAERAAGQSGYSFRKLMRLWLRMLVNFSVMPLRVATILGGALSCVGLLAAVLVVLEALFTATPSGWGSLMASVLVFAGIQLLMLGLIGEYLGRIYLTLNQKPQFVVRSLFRNSPSPQTPAPPDRPA